MLALIPIQYRLVASIIVAIGIGAAGAWAGWHTASDHFAAKSAQAERLAAQKYRAAVERGNEAAQRLITAENQIREITKWKGTQIENFTTGKSCLSADALLMLNATAVPRFSARPGRHFAESRAAPPPTGGNSASDTDVAKWVVVANEKYDICAARLNEAVDFMASVNSDKN